MKILAVAPVWNEEERIGNVVESIPRELINEIVVVDDGSSDNSIREARSRGAHVIEHGSNRGVGAAIRSGIRYGIEKEYEIIVIMSGGAKTPGEQIPRLTAPILEKNYDFVQGSRYVKGGKSVKK